MRDNRSRKVAQDNGYDVADLIERTSYGPIYRSTILHTEYLSSAG